MTRTSATHPLKIDAVQVPGGRGWIGMTFCPGKKQADAASGAWDRDLDADLEAIRAWGAEILVSLIEEHEYRRLSVESMGDRMPAGILHLKLPIRDASTPDEEWEQNWNGHSGALVKSVLYRGGKVCLHCMGGLGRTGLLAARILIEFGVLPQDAIASVRAARQETIETDEQERYLIALRPLWERMDRYRGCLLAGAVGDALGAPLEFKKASDRKAMSGLPYRDFMPAYGHRGAITDDTQMTLFTAEGLLRCYVHGSIRGLENLPGVVNHAYLRWLATQGHAFPRGEVGMDGWLIGNKELFSGRAPGSTCLSALHARESISDFRPAKNNSKGCGGIMRVAPVGMFASIAKWEGAFDLARDIAALTHGHPTGQLAAGVFAVLIRDILEGASLPEALATAKEDLVRHPMHEETLSAIEAAERLAAGPESAELCLPRLGEGWVAEEALALSLFCALRARTLEEGIVMAANIQGDCDSTGSIVGNLLGARFGASAIPPRWLAGLELRDVVCRVAEDMAAMPVIKSTLLDYSSDPLPETEPLLNKSTEYWSARYPPW